MLITSLSGWNSPKAVSRAIITRHMIRSLASGFVPMPKTIRLIQFFWGHVHSLWLSTLENKVKWYITIRSRLMRYDATKFQAEWMDSPILLKGILVSFFPPCRSSSPFQFLWQDRTRRTLKITLSHANPNQVRYKRRIMNDVNLIDNLQSFIGSDNTGHQDINNNE